jgi:hypothetical protein
LLAGLLGGAAFSFRSGSCAKGLDAGESFEQLIEIRHGKNSPA